MWHITYAFSSLARAEYMNTSSKEMLDAWSVRFEMCAIAIEYDSSGIAYGIIPSTHVSSIGVLSTVDRRLKGHEPTHTHAHLEWRTWHM